MLHLPTAVVHLIFRHVNQERRFAVMLTCRSMYTILRDPMIWDTLTVYEMNSHAVEFVKDVCPSKLNLESSSPTDVIWLLQQCQFLASKLIHLGIALGHVHCVPIKLADVLAKYWALVSLRIVCHSLRIPSSLVFNAQTMLPYLQKLVVIDRGIERNLSVRFEATPVCGMPLEHVSLVVYCSDIVSKQNAAAWARTLHSLTYRAENDPMDDFVVHDFSLQILDIEIRFNTNTLHVFRQLSKCHIKHLEITTYDNLYIGRPLQAEHVFIQLCSPGFLADVDFLSMTAPSRLKSLGFQGGAQSTVTFYNVPNITAFASFVHNKHVVCEGMTVHVEP